MIKVVLKIWVRKNLAIGRGLRPSVTLVAVPVHLVAGIWGTLALGLFATGAYGAPTAIGASTTSVVTGLFYGGGMTQPGLQALGSFSTVIAALGIAPPMIARSIEIVINCFIFNSTLIMHVLLSTQYGML